MSWQARVMLGQDSLETQHRWIDALRQTAGHFACKSAKCTRRRDDRCWLMVHGDCGQGTNGRVGDPARKDSGLVPVVMLSAKETSHTTQSLRHICIFPPMSSHCCVRVTFTYAPQTCMRTHTHTVLPLTGTYTVC